MSGCLGGSDVETSEGDDVVLEDTDDWPTYYVQTASDLPTCDASTPANLGRLYYVEADTNFQACMSTGWQVVQLGGSGSTLVLNQAPVIAATPECDDEDIADDGDSTFTQYCGLSWSALDVDGTIASIGVDHDLDGIIDINLPSDSGKDMTSPAAHAGFDGMLGVPLEDGITYTIHESYRDRPGCVITFMKTMNFIVIDDDGAKTILPTMVLQHHELDNRTNSDWFTGLGIDSADVDWLTGVAVPSPCGEMPTFTFADHSDTLTDMGGDNLVAITMNSGSFDLAPSSVEFHITVTWESSSTGGFYHWGSDVMTATMADPNLAQAGDSWVISANTDYCSNGQNPQTCTGNVKVRISYEGDWTFSHEELMQLA